MKAITNQYGVDKEYLLRSKQMTPGARLDWLAAAREFSMNKKMQTDIRKHASMRFLTVGIAIAMAFALVFAIMQAAIAH